MFYGVVVMSDMIHVPLIVQSSSTGDFLACRRNHPAHPRNGDVELLTKSFCADTLATWRSEWESGELSDRDLYDRIEKLFSCDLTQVMIDPTQSISVQWIGSFPSFHVHEQPHLFPAYLLQDQVLMADMTALNRASYYLVDHLTS